MVLLILVSVLVMLSTLLNILNMAAEILAVVSVLVILVSVLVISSTVPVEAPARSSGDRRTDELDRPHRASPSPSLKTYNLHNPCVILVVHLHLPSGLLDKFI